MQITHGATTTVDKRVARYRHGLGQLAFSLTPFTSVSVVLYRLLASECYCLCFCLCCLSFRSSHMCRFVAVWRCSASSVSHSCRPWCSSFLQSVLGCFSGSLLLLVVICVPSVPGATSLRLCSSRFCMSIPLLLLMLYLCIFAADGALCRHLCCRLPVLCGLPYYLLVSGCFSLCAFLPFLCVVWLYCNPLSNDGRLKAVLEAVFSDVIGWG